MSSSGTEMNNSEALELSDKWIKEIFIPKLIQDGKISSLLCNKNCDSEYHRIGSVGGTSKTNDIQLVSIEVKPLAVDGFMLTAPCRVEIEYRAVNTHASAEPLKKNVIVKRTPNIPKDIYKACQFDFLFQNEMIAYTEIIPLLNQAKKYPRFYYMERKELNAVCVLEDFSQYGWKTAKQLYNLPLQHILLAVRELATFHGEMYALKDSNSKLFKDIVSRLAEARWSNDEIMEEYNIKLITCRKRVVKALRDSDKSNYVPESFTNMFLEYTSDPLTCFRKQVSSREPLAVLCHGDYLRNNIAYKFDNKDNPTDVMMYDFQTVRYASPMVDLVMLLLVSASHQIRQNSFVDIFEFYNNTLTETYCNKLNIEAYPSHFTPKAFMKEYALCFPYGLLIAASFLPLHYEPIEMNWNDMKPPSMEEQIKEAMEHGGKQLDIELAHMLVEFYDLCQTFKIESM